MSEEQKVEEVEETAVEKVAAEAPAEKKKDDGVKEIAFDELGLTKPLEKMTTKELRALCMNKLPMITGASGKDKDELVQTIKDVFGIVDAEQVSPYKKQIAEIKRQIRALRVEKDAITDRDKRDYMRRKINKLKKRTRKLARAV